MFTEFQPENWTNVDFILKGMMIVGLAWLVLSILVYLRRRATNLTPVDGPGINPEAQPDFLSIDLAKRKSALKRGDQYEETLKRREQVSGDSTTTQKARNICGYVAVVLAALSLSVVVAGSIWPTSANSETYRDDGIEVRLMDLVQSHPIAISIALFAICFSIWHLAVYRKPKFVSA